MRTEIVIPFAFDTAPVEKLLQEQGEAEVMKRLDSIVMEGIKKALPEKEPSYSYGAYRRHENVGEPEIDWQGYVNEKLSSWINQHSQEIIDEAALLMAARGARKKAWREVLAEVKEEQ